MCTVLLLLVVPFGVVHADNDDNGVNGATAADAVGAEYGASTSTTTEFSKSRRLLFESAQVSLG